MHEQLSANTNEGLTFEEDAQALLVVTAAVVGKRVEKACRRLPAALERGREVCGAVRSKVIANAQNLRGPAVKTLVSLAVVLSCGLGPAFGATNETYGTPGGIVFALPRRISAYQPPSGGVTTTICENMLFQHAPKGMDTKSLNSCSNGELLALGQQVASTNRVPPVERTALGPVNVTAVPPIPRRAESFSDQDKYGGILYKAYGADNPFQLLNPFAPREYGQSEAAELPRDRLGGVPSGLSVFSIRFK